MKLKFLIFSTAISFTLDKFVFIFFYQDLFGHLVPLAVQQAIAVYETKRTEILNMETSRLREGTTLMNGILASLNLPAALEDFCNHEAVPTSVKEKATEVRNAGGINTIQVSNFKRHMIEIQMIAYFED